VLIRAGRKVSPAILPVGEDLPMEGAGCDSAAMRLLANLPRKIERRLNRAWLREYARMGNDAE